MITVTDDALGANRVSVSDSTNFEVIGTGLYLKAGAVLDHETAPSYTVMVSAAGTGTGANPPAQRFVLTIANAEETGRIGGWASVPVQGLFCLPLL